MVERRMDEVIRTVDALVQVEKAVGEFYGSCSEFFADDSDFWLGLAHDEFLHADVLAKLHETIIREPDKFRLGELFPITTLRAFVSQVHSDHEKLIAGTLTMHDALVAAYKIEQSIIEQKSLEAIKTEKQEYLEALDILAEETAAHRDRIKTKLDECRKSGRGTGKDKKTSE
jgi:hypothetical protein